MAAYSRKPLLGISDPKTVRWNLTKRRAFYEEAKAKFKPSKELFCSKCIVKGMVKDAFSFCKVCRDFQCDVCTEKHESTLLTMNHGILVGNEMIGRYKEAVANSPSKSCHSREEMVEDGRASLQYPSQLNDSFTDSRASSRRGTAEPELLCEKRIRVPEDRRNCFICASVVYDDGKVLLADANNNNLKLFSKSFKCMHTFKLKQEPWDACKAVNFREDLFVTEAKIKGIHQFKVDKDLKYVFTLKLDGECFGVASWKGGIAVSVKQNRKFSVKLIDKFGTVIRNITSGLGGKLKLNKPWYLASMKKGQYVLISDSGSGCITCIDVDKHNKDDKVIKFTYRNKKQIYDPRSICTDENGNIFVVDYEADTLHQLSSTGQEQGVVLCDGLSSPCGLSCNDQLLYLQPKMDSNSIKVYDISE